MKETKQTENLNPKSKVDILKIGAQLFIFNFHNSIFVFPVCKKNKPFYSFKDVQLFKISSQVTHYSFKIEEAVFETPYLTDKILRQCFSSTTQVNKSKYTCKFISSKFYLGTDLRKCLEFTK